MNTGQSAEFISSVSILLQRIYKDEINNDDVMSNLNQIQGCEAITDTGAREIRTLLKSHFAKGDQLETVRSIGICGRKIARKLEEHGKPNAARIVLMGASDLLNTKPFDDWGLCQFQLGRLWRQCQQPGRSLTAFINAEDIFDQRDMQFELAACWKFQGHLLVKNNPLKAVAKFQMAFMLFEKLGDDLAAAKCLRHIADHMLSSGDLETAIELLESINRTFLFYHDIGRSLVVLQRQLDCYKQMGSAEDVSRVIEDLKRTSDVVKQRRATPDVDLVTAGNRCAELRFEEALSAYQRAEERYERSGEMDRSLIAERMVGSVLCWMDNSRDALKHLDVLLLKESIINDSTDLESRIWFSKAVALTKDKQFYAALHSYHNAERTAEATHAQRTLGYIYENMAEILDRQGNNEGALDLYRAASEIDDPILGECHKAYLELQIGGSLTKRAGQSARALDYFNFAQGIFDKWKLTSLQAQCLLDTAEAYFNLKRFDEAAEWFRKALDLGVGIYMRRIQASAKSGRAHVFAERGEISLAIHERQQANEIYQGIDREDSLRRNLLNKEFLELGRHPENIPPSYFQSFTWKNPPDPLSDVKELSLRAAFELKRGKYLTDQQSRHGQALECFNNARKILSEINQAHGELWFQVHCYRSIALSRSGETHKVKQALEEIPTTSNDSHYQRWLKQYAQGLAYYHSKHDGVVPTFLKSLEALRDFRESQLIPELRLTFFREHSGIFQELVLIACKLGDKHFAFRVIQEAKGRTFSDLQANRTSDAMLEGKPILSERLQTRRRILVEAWKHQTAKSTQGQETNDKFLTEQIDFDPLEFDYLRELEGYYFNRKQATPITDVSLTEIQSALHDDQAILDFFCLPNQLVLLWTFKHLMHITVLECPDETTAKVVDSVLDWDSVDTDKLTLSQHVRVLKEEKLIGLWRRFSERLGVPVLKIVEKHGIKDLFIVPHQGLGSVPLHALELAHEPTPEFLGDHVAISYLPSASAFVQLRPYRGIGITPDMTLFLDPDGSLPYSREESLIADSLVGQEHLRVFKGDEANADSFWMHWDTKRVLVLSVHGLARRHSYLSFLMLHDDLVFMHQVMEAKPSLDQTDLVMLNACESGFRDRRAPDESMGIMASFLIAGAASVFSTLWRVNDLCAFLVTQEFLIGVLSDHLKPSVALQKAINSVRTMEKKAILTKSPKSSKVLDGFPEHAVPFAHPYFWSPFLVMGRIEGSNHQTTRLQTK